MEGVVDHLMRDLLTQINDYDLCITEFVRVVNRKVPKHTFYKLCPELKLGGKTPSGTPVRVQLLGQDPNWMAENALIAHDLGTSGVDINFGCPAKTVNKSQGGASLLKDPELMYQVISNVKSALSGTEQPLSAKIRLGFDDTSLLDEIVDAIAQAQPDMLTVHARTKRQGYKPPAYWEYIADIKSKLTIPVIANGEIWQRSDAQRCIEKSHCNDLMIGRGALATPNLANVLKYNDTPMTWEETCQLILDWTKLDDGEFKPFYFSSRLKQWYRYLKYFYPQAATLFDAIKTLQHKAEIVSEIERIIRVESTEVL
ncbi:tRNA-dihydrouridine synthase [Thalassotalea euphylliae]|uniref:tRNA-dihydrouridine(16) synthase n=1 Tax=Thalassotalea euphylliae TaxID=1655234 RepID=A0A3E0UGH6_9GAMM|nr:tRNA-dihydrouridine synthase [Thalassotalea euphylliae]REL36151.1 tRNA dihydrouridine(16) synthase DusC [Thalassotalea euphylliae]